MSAIKLYLDAAEYAAVRRLSEQMKIKPEDLLYAALNRLMTQQDDPEMRRDVLQTRDWRGENLPLWSDSAGSVHAYESMPDEASRPSRKPPSV